jgi:hypothetical protein
MSNPLSPTARYALTFAAVVITTIATADPFGLPTWAQVILGALSTAAAAVGLIPPRVPIIRGHTQRAPGNPKYVAFRRDPT